MLEDIIHPAVRAVKAYSAIFKEGYRALLDGHQSKSESFSPARHHGMCQQKHLDQERNRLGLYFVVNLVVSS